MYLFNSQAFYRHTLILLLITTSLLLSGCGFHLKHNNGLVEKFPEIYLQTSQPMGELARLVRLRLRGANIKILTQQTPKSAVLALQSEQRSSRTISLYANALSAENEIGYVLNYSLRIPNYTAKNFTVNIYRDFLDDSSEALAKSRETELITKELRVIAADHIITSMLSMKNEATE